MGWLKTAGYLFKIILFFLKSFREKDKKKAENQAKIGVKIVEAFKETNSHRRDSAMVSAIDDINRL